MFLNYYELRSSVVSQEEIHWYLQDLSTIPLLSPKAELEIIQQIAANPRSASSGAARTKLIETNLHLVVRLARCYQPFGLALADLVQEGNLALMEATQQFDPQRSRCFRHFAARQVHRKLYRVVEEYLRGNHLTESGREFIYPLNAQVFKALAHNAIDEQALVLDLPKDRFVPLDILLKDENTDLFLNDDRPSIHMYNREKNEASSPEEISIMQELGNCIVDCLQTLTAEERLVLIHRYLLDDLPTLEQVGLMLGINLEQTRQAEEQGIRKLRHPRIAKKLCSML